jgi:serine/threonine-protein kinase HipA
MDRHSTGRHGAAVRRSLDRFASRPATVPLPALQLKNFSIQLLPAQASRFKLTPLYDVMSAYPVIGDGPNHWAAREVKLAMALMGKNRHYHVHAIQRRHFNSTAKKLGYGDSAEPLLNDILEKTPKVVEQVQAALPSGFSQEVADKILGGLLDAARALGAAPQLAS